MTPEELAEGVMSFVRMYCVFPSEDEYVAVTLWIMHTHCLGAFETTPRLGIISPEKQCGKTRVLEVLGLLCKEALSTLNITTAALYRSINSLQPTLLLDEADAIFGKKNSEFHEDLRGILNAGHRRGNKVVRCENFGRDIVHYETFAAVAMAGIGALPDTITDRAVVIHLRRRKADEAVTPFRERKARSEAEPLVKGLEKWGAEVLSCVSEFPELPEGLVDRPADVWEPLIAIADCIGGEWGGKAREVAVRMVNAHRLNDGSVNVQLLYAIRGVFNSLPVGQRNIHSEALIILLNRMLEAPWSNWNFGQGISAKALAQKLKAFDVESKNVKVDGIAKKGYTREAFQDPWERYCKGETPGFVVIGDLSAESPDATDGQWS